MKKGVVSYQDKMAYNLALRLKGKRKVKHKARVPGTVRPSRLPGGSGYRNNPQ